MRERPPAQRGALRLVPAVHPRPPLDLRDHDLIDSHACLSRPVVKEQLERLTLQMYREGMRYSEAVREFQKTFLGVVLRDHDANQVKAAKRLKIHRNTLRPQISEMELDIRALRGPRRRPPVSDLALARGTRAKAT